MHEAGPPDHAVFVDPVNYFVPNIGRFSTRK